MACTINTRRPQLPRWWTRTQLFFRIVSCFSTIAITILLLVVNGFGGPTGLAVWVVTHNFYFDVYEILTTASFLYKTANATGWKARPPAFPPAVAGGLQFLIVGLMYMAVYLTDVNTGSYCYRPGGNSHFVYYFALYLLWLGHGPLAGLQFIFLMIETFRKDPTPPPSIMTDEIPLDKPVNLPSS